jgi:hypothetical protein
MAPRTGLGSHSGGYVSAKAWLIILVLIAGCLIGCNSSEGEQERVQATVASEALAGVSATLAALPLATPYATQVTYDTATPYAISSPYSMVTPYYTPTPYKTATAYPTNTPYATYTPILTVTWEAIATITAVSNPPPAQSTSAPAITTREGLLLLMQTAHMNMGLLIGDIDVAIEGEKDVNCVTAVQHYDSFVPVTVIDLTNSPASVQNGYGAYRASVEIVVNQGGIIRDCRNQINANGSGGITYTAWSFFRRQLALAMDNLNIAIQQLQIAADS